MVVAGTGAVAALVLRRPGVAAFGAIFALGFVAALGLRQDPGRVLSALASSVPHCVIEGRIAEQTGGLGTLVSVDEAMCAGHPGVRNAGVVIVDELDLHPGTSIVAEGWLMSFGTDRWDRARARTRADAAFAAKDVRRVAAPNGVLAVAASVRTSLMRATEDLDLRHAALIRGLTIGDTSDMDEATEHAFRRTGLTHLVAVSGSNVALVLAVVGLFARNLPLTWRGAVCLLALAFYVVVVGPEPSVLRAAAMGAVTLAGLVWGRRSEPLQALGIALIVLCLLRPDLVTSVGLHLSAGATAGIVLWGRSLALFFARRLPAPIAFALGATLAAQIAVAPVLVLVFGEISLVAPLANVLAFAAVAPATILGLAAALVGLLVPAGGSLLGGLAGPCAAWIVAVAETLARPTWAAVEVSPVIGWMGAVVVVGAAGRTLARTPSATGLQ